MSADKAVKSFNLAPKKSSVDVLGHNRIKTEASGIHFVAPKVKNGQRKIRIQFEEAKSEVDR